MWAYWSTWKTLLWNCIWTIFQFNEVHVIELFVYCWKYIRSTDLSCSCGQVNTITFDLKWRCKWRNRSVQDFGKEGLCFSCHIWDSATLIIAHYNRPNSCNFFCWNSNNWKRRFLPTETQARSEFSLWNEIFLEAKKSHPSSFFTSPFSNCSFDFTCDHRIVQCWFQDEVS